MSLADFIKHLFYYLLIKVTRLCTDIIIVIIIIIVNIIVCTFISFLSLLLEVNKVILSYLIDCKNSIIANQLMRWTYRTERKKFCM